jgi:hypothetical protein
MYFFSLIWFTLWNISSFYLKKRKMVFDLEEEPLCTQIVLVNDKHNTYALEKIINKMQPLIKKYVRKLYFMEEDDASQELIIALIEAIYHIKLCNNDAMCLSYLQKSIVHKYYNLCKISIKASETTNEFADTDYSIPYYENYDDVELIIDIQQLLKNETDTKKSIIKYFLFSGYSDTQIATKMHMSRQYINRVKKEFIKEYIESFQKN